MPIHSLFSVLFTLSCCLIFNSYRLLIWFITLRKKLTSQEYLIRFEEEILRALLDRFNGILGLTDTKLSNFYQLLEHLFKYLYVMPEFLSILDLKIFDIQAILIF